ncbi:MAG TPA: hypothetical protein VGL71_01020, partial [Urbifossiella sp.]
MKRSLAVLLIAFATFTAAHAADQGDWNGEWVLPRNQKIPIGDEKGKPLGAWPATAGKVRWTGKL